MTFLTRTTGESLHATSILLVERGNPMIIKSRYRPMQEEEEDISANSNSRTTTNIRNDQNERDGVHINENHHQGVKATTESAPPALPPFYSSPSSSLSSSSWSLASSPRPHVKQPRHPQEQHQQGQVPPQQQPKKQQQQSVFLSSSPPPLNANRFQTSVIAKRLDESVAAMATTTKQQQVNRSADLVPLTHDYDKMKRRLRALIASTKQYHDSMARMHRARMEVVVRLAAVSSNTPIHEKIAGGINNTSNPHTSSSAATATASASSAHNHQTCSSSSSPTDSLASVHKSAFIQCRMDAGAYQESIVEYIVEWERVISTRVDASLDHVHGLQQKLHHYQQKVGNLRKKVHGIENSSSGSGSSIMGNATAQLLSGVTRVKHINASSGIPVKLEEKLERNQQKLEQAWKEHESAASMLCHLLEQVTHKGWKDLAPLCDKAMEWECDRAMHDYKVFTRLSNLRQETNDLVQRMENCEVLCDPPPSFISNSSAGGGRVGARSNSGGSPVDIPVMVTSDNDEDTESSDSFPQFFPDDEVGIESPPRSRSRETTMPARPSLDDESPTSFFDQEIMSNRIISSSPRNNNVKQASCSSIVVETIE